jgi:hypothetical protein
MDLDPVFLKDNELIQIIRIKGHGFGRNWHLQLSCYAHPFLCAYLRFLALNFRFMDAFAKAEFGIISCKS